MCARRRAPSRGSVGGVDQAEVAVVATVEDGKLTQVNADPAHPNGCICVKGAAAPEIVYSPDRMQYPMVRTRPKGDPDPGWHEISWDDALARIAMQMQRIPRSAIARPHPRRSCRRRLVCPTLRSGQRRRRPVAAGL